MKYFKLTLILFSLIFYSCGSTSQYSGGSARVARYRAGGGENSTERLGFNPQDKRILIYNASLKISTYELPDSINTYLTRVVQRYEGYMVQIGYNQTQVRVPSKRLAEFLGELSTSHRVSNKVITGEDITVEFYDLQLRLENALKSRDRYLELLKQAENVATTLEVEKELERITTSIESMKGRLNRLGHLAEFATVTIQIDKMERPGILGYVFKGVYKGVKWLFVRD